MILFINSSHLALSKPPESISEFRFVM